MVVKSDQPSSVKNQTLIFRTLFNMNTEVMERVIEKLTDLGVGLEDVSAEEVKLHLRSVLVELSNERWDSVMGSCPNKTVAFRPDLFTEEDFEEVERSESGRHTRPIRKIPNR